MADHGSGSRLEQAFDGLKAQVETARAPSDLYARIAHRVEARPGGARSGWRPALSAAGIAAVLLGGLLAWWLLRTPVLGGFQVESASTDFRSRVTPDGLLVVESGQASLRVAGLATRISLAGSARLRREDRGVRVVQGTAAFEVEPRRAAPLTVYVSGGRIEVLGTRFTVVQGHGAGEVSLSRGSIRFVDAEGRETVLRPGERLRWPPPPAIEPPAPPPAIEAPAPPPAPPPRRPAQRPPARAPRPPPASASPTPPPAPAAQVTEAVAREQQRRILGEIDRLRIRREDDLLVRRLDEILAEGVSEPLRERLSFERCDVLAHRAGEERRACSEIARHLSAYPGGEYTSRLEQSRRSLGCSP